MVKQAERTETTRKAIVTAARGLFGGHGFHATTMEEIAEAIGMAKGAVYHHFRTKEAIFEAVFEEASQDLVRHVRAAVRHVPDALRAMAIGTHAYFEACAQPSLAQIILRDGPAVLGWQRWREIDERYFGRSVPEALRRAIEAGLIAEQPVEPLARLLIGAITEAAAACASSSDPAAVGRRHADAMQALLEGLRTSKKTRVSNSER
jgi:AcrR family transcriptional regulator